MTSDATPPRMCGGCGKLIATYDVVMWRGDSSTPPYHARCYPGTVDTITILLKRVESLEARLAFLEGDVVRAGADITLGEHSIARIAKAIADRLQKEGR